MISKNTARSGSQSSHGKGAEHRRHARLNTSVDGEIRFSNSVIRVQMLDLSKSGALLKLVNQPPSMPKIGEPVHISLRWPLAAAKKLEVDASLVRIEGGAVAVQFDHLKYEAAVRMLTGA
jgi:hypothetical protein